MKDLGRLLGSAALAGALLGSTLMNLAVIIGSAAYDEVEFLRLVARFLGGLLMVSLIAGPVVLISVTIFGTISAFLVDRLRPSRWASLAIVSAFACMPIALTGIWAGGAGGDRLDEAANWLMICSPFAASAAFVLWRGLMRRRQTDASVSIS